MSQVAPTVPPANKDGIASEEDQVKVLAEAKTVVKTQGFYMKRSLDQNQILDALKHASNMICELRTSLLSPKNYYALYIEAFDQLRYLESYLLEEKHGKKMAELYELVQYAGNILPRLYLIVTVGSAYVKLKEAPAKDVLRDLVEMCRGVQHPTRGLFLRTYLSEMVKDKLPDTGSEYEGRGGSVRDAVEFILVNFTEMNKLWVRLQFQGAARDREKRENERGELKLLVGKNIARLSQLEGVDLETYSKGVLPRLVEQIVGCRDVTAQQYLMECIIQVFPDEYHLRTLEILLPACAQLQPGVNLKTVLVSLIDRLASFSTREKIPDDIDVFGIFSKQIKALVEQQETMPLEDILALEASLLNLSMTCYASHLEYVDQIFQFSAEVIEKKKEFKDRSPVVKQILAILNSPLDTYQNITTVLSLENYKDLIQFLSFDNRKKIAIEILRTCSEYPTEIGSSELVNKLLDLIEPLIKDSTDQPDSVDEEDFALEQNLVASLVHLFENENLEQLFSMYVTARKHFGAGGPKRIQHTLPPLVFRALKLALRLKASEDEDWSAKAIKVFKFAHETVTALSKTNLPHLALRLFLQCAQAADKCGSAFETIGYEFFTQAFIIYEEQISDSQSQFNALNLFIGALQSISVFGEENYDTLITKTALHSSKLLKKPDQCRAVYMCSHLFWSTHATKEYKNGKRVLECLQKSLKIADTCMDSSMNVHLFVEILNQYLYYFENGCEVVTVQYLSGLIELINTNIANMDGAETTAITTHYKNTLEFIKWKKQSDNKYADIEI